jgi:hypothetical protein
MTIESFIVPLNMLPKKVIFEIFSGFHYSQQNFSNCIKYIFPHALLICLQIEQLANVYEQKSCLIKKSQPCQSPLKINYKSKILLERRKI